MTEIESALHRLFEHQNHRIVFWYDDKGELTEQFAAVALPGVEKITLNNNEFAVKHRLLREAPRQRFLVYSPAPPPADADNWLLDVQLSSGRFYADRTDLWLHELGLPPEFAAELAPHADFFQAARRRQALHKLLRPDDTARQVRLKMLAVCAAAPDEQLDHILYHLLDELAAGGEEKMRLIERAALDGFLWEQLERAYGYRSDRPGLLDFALELFNACYALGIGEVGRRGSTRGATANAFADGNTAAVVFLRRWKDHSRHQKAFETLSDQFARDLSIANDIARRDLDTLLELDYFELIDQRILSELARGVAARTMTAEQTEEVLRNRRQSHWYGRYAHAYEATGHAAAFFHALDHSELAIHSLRQGVEQYGRHWSRLDQLYRQFIYHLRRARESAYPHALDPLAEAVENHYTNNFLLPLNDRWQPFVDAARHWDIPPIPPQQSFFERLVQPVLGRGNKLIVIVSDALRYEIGEELLHRIRQEDRYEATLEAALAMLPSYTQLGMAALLPHERLRLDEKGNVFVDGQSARGTANRQKILQQATKGGAAALQAEELLAMGKEESRALFRDHALVYIYHNRIDRAGDTRDTEERVFDEAEATLQELIQLIKKLAAANASNMVVTADHGFIYQNQTLDESDFAGNTPLGAEITKSDRRYVLGRGLVETSSFKKFTAAEAGLAGDIEMLIPKSINRLRLRGAGSRYVHGGATLQEVVIPVIQINKKRQSDVAAVEVEILRGGSTVITTNQLSVRFYQTAAVTEKRQPRLLRAGLYTEAGELISDVHELLFDQTTEEARQRERPVRFLLSAAAEAANGQEVILKLEERIGDTAHFREYKSARYTLRRAFTSDFDL